MLLSPLRILTYRSIQKTVDIRTRISDKVCATQNRKHEGRSAVIKIDQKRKEERNRGKEESEIDRQTDERQRQRQRQRQRMRQRGREYILKTNTYVKCSMLAMFDDSLSDFISRATLSTSRFEVSPRLIVSDT